MLPRDVACARIRYGKYQRRAEERNYSWELTFDEFVAITSKNCWYCDREPDQFLKRFPNLRHNGIDRVDNSRGYCLDNVVPCCDVCNRAKSGLDLLEFIDLARKIAERHGANASPQRIV